MHERGRGKDVVGLPKIDEAASSKVIFSCPNFPSFTSFSAWGRFVTYFMSRDYSQEKHGLVCTAYIKTDFQENIPV